MDQSAGSLALLEWMATYRVTSSELARGAGVSVKTVSRWRLEQAVPTGATAEALIRFCAAHGTRADANTLAAALGVAPPPDPAGAVVVAAMTPDQLGVALFLAAEQFRLPARGLRMAMQRMVADWRARSCTLEDVQRAFDGLERLASAATVATTQTHDERR